MALARPQRRFQSAPLITAQVAPADLIRISSHLTGEPYFCRSGANRFDDYRRPKKHRFGTCYFGLSLAVAFAETVLHDELPVNGKFTMTWEKLEALYVVRFSGAVLTLADLTGVALKRSGADSSISTACPYDLPQRWSVAIHKHPQKVDGILYMSRQLNSEKAVVVFDRARRKVRRPQSVPLPMFPEAWRTAFAMGVTPE